MDEFGLPGMQALDNPYGLRPTGAPTRAQPLPAVALPRILAPVVELAQRMQSGGGGGMGRPRVAMAQPAAGNVAPIRATAVPGQGGDFPVVGKNMSIEQFTNIIKKEEGGNNYQALNREKPGNTASGAYQYTDSTWNNYGGYAKAMFAPKEIQDRRFQEDLAGRLHKYGGDLFKAAADHYLPAYAASPANWNEPVKIKTRGGIVTVKPVASYLKQILRSTPYADLVDDYINAHK